MRRLAVLTLVVTAAVGLAAPPALEVPAEVKPAGSYARFTPKTDGVSVVYVGLDGLDPFPAEELKDGKRFLLPVGGVKAGRYRFVAVAAGATGEQTRADFTVVIGDAPKPVDPVKPDDPPPAPQPVASFRVILVYESGDLLTAAQRAVVSGVTVESWLTANCTGGEAGWRRRDKDAPGEADPTMAALWSAVQASLKPTDPPCVAVEVNGKVTIIPLDATPAQMVATLKTYRGAK